MKTPAQADLQRWSDEVARDPRSLAFLPLARAYRRRGLRDAALQLCLRGLEAYPSHVEAHGLLALLYLEGGDRMKAADEWSMVLRIDPDDFAALRGMGFCYLEDDQLSRARQMLERAALQRPADPTVQEALRVLGTKQQAAAAGTAPAPPPGGTADYPFEAEPWLDSGLRHERRGEIGAADAAPPSTATRSAAAAPSAATPQDAFARVDDPIELFDELLSAGPLLGALMVDAQGLVLAGRLTEAVAGEAATLGAVLGGAIGEATRTATHLALGDWRGILLEAEHALLHLAPLGPDAVVVLAARRNTPAGWMLRAAGQASHRAARYLEAYT
jgi:predicted regulator of Ras-like GTPase activity (Roadblock/LC7/MglB family)